MKKQELKDAVRKYIVAEVFNGSAPAEFTDDMLMISTRIMDSIITLNMINYFEELLGIELQAHEVNIDNLDSVNLASNFLAAKAGLTD